MLFIVKHLFKTHFFVFFITFVQILKTTQYEKKHFILFYCFYSNSHFLY